MEFLPIRSLITNVLLVPVGNWLSVNGEAIYSTRPWTVCQSETISSVFYTTKHVQNEGTNEKLLYAIFIKWPTNNMLQLRCVAATSATKIYFLGLHYNDNSADTSLLYHSITGNNAMDHDDVESNAARMKQRRDERDIGIEVVLPALTPDIIPCQHAWVIVLTHIANL